MLFDTSVGLMSFKHDSSIHDCHAVNIVLRCVELLLHISYMQSADPSADYA